MEEGTNMVVGDASKWTDKISLMGRVGSNVEANKVTKKSRYVSISGWL